MRKSVSMLIAVLFLLAPLHFARSSPAAEKGLTGKWVTDTVVAAAQQKKAKEEARLAAEPIVDPFAPAGGPRRGPRGNIIPGQGAGPRQRGNNFLQSSPAQSTSTVSRQSPRDEADEDDAGPQAPAIILDLKLDKAKLTGTAVIMYPEAVADDKLKVEDASMKDKTFKFLTYKKAANVQIGTQWLGEQVSENTIKITRQTLSGKAIDAVGSITFSRAN